MSDHEYQVESCSDIEMMIRSAGTYVGASDDLRPRTMEAAREQSFEKHAKRTLTRVMLAIGLVFFLIAPLMQQVSKLPVPVGLSSHEIQRRAVNQAHCGVEYHWAIVDVFSDLRRNQDGS